MASQGGPSVLTPVDANEALFVSLVSLSPSRQSFARQTFHPRFTYPIFGDDEVIFGYQNPRIYLQYNATDMRPNVSVTYSKKAEAAGTGQPTDIEGTLRNHLPEVAFQKESEFESAIKNAPEDWTPPGELVATFKASEAAFEAQDRTFEIWKGNMADPAVKSLVERTQILVLLFIEGGKEIFLDDPDIGRWTIFFLYQKRASSGDPSRTSYVFAGFCTVYSFLHPLQSSLMYGSSPAQTELDKSSLDKDFDLSKLPCRTRISQFLILPPFQQKGLGPRLYSIIFQEYLKHPQTFEITVEDPNEAFDDLRDIADLQFLRQMPEFQQLRINESVVIPKSGLAPNNIVDKAAWDAVRAKAKMAPRQFARVLEMHLMSQLPAAVRPGIAPEKSAPRATKEQQHEYRLWRLLVKIRLYKHNRDALGQLEIPERVKKLEEAVSSVEFDYARLLIKAEEQQKKLSTNGSAIGKRKLTEVEDGEQSESKKARVEDE
ncbi:hypothetical protein VTK56DRAFT_7725 [Thermocarpiscus australiensis]